MNLKASGLKSSEAFIRSMLVVYVLTCSLGVLLRQNQRFAYKFGIGDDSRFAGITTQVLCAIVYGLN